MSNEQPYTEHLQAGGGSPLPPKRGGRRGLLIGGGAVLLVALVGGGVWGWQAYFAQGPQPAEALPADTAAYLSVDLDPSGAQKVEALRTLRKFPAFKEEVGLETDDDLREELFDAMQDDGVCSDLDYADDIEPWLGDRAAVAMLDVDDQTPVFVVQVKDQDKAADGLDALVNCGSDAAGASEEVGGYAFNGDWVVLAETEQLATDAVDAAKESSLADDADYDRWTSALGDAGVLNTYAAPEAGELLTRMIESELGSETDATQEKALEQLADFPGAAGTIRFDDGSLEVEVVTGQLESESATVLAGDNGGDTVATLPESTAVAVGAGFREGWGEVALDQLTPLIEEETGTSVEEAIAEAEQQVGIDLPEDVETMLGESFAVAMDSEFATEDLLSPDGPEDVPAGVKITGDPEEIEPVLEQLRSSMDPEAGEALEWSVEGDHVVVGFSPDYLDKIQAEGDLGGTDAFERVIPEADSASALLFANFDADDWLVRVIEDMGAPDEVVDNVKPLEAAGFSSWTDGDDVHVQLTITTED